MESLLEARGSRQQCRLLLSVFGQANVKGSERDLETVRWLDAKLWQVSFRQLPEYIEVRIKEGSQSCRSEEG